MIQSTRSPGSNPWEASHWRSSISRRPATQESRSGTPLRKLSTARTRHPGCADSLNTASVSRKWLHRKPPAPVTSMVDPFRAPSQGARNWQAASASSRMVRVVAALRVNKLIHLRLTEIGDVSFIGGERAGVYRTPTSYRLPATSTPILAENRRVWGREAVQAAPVCLPPLHCLALPG